MFNKKYMRIISYCILSNLIDIHNC